MSRIRNTGYSHSAFVPVDVKTGVSNQGCGSASKAGPDPDTSPHQSDGNLRPLVYWYRLQVFFLTLLSLHCERPRPSTAIFETLELLTFDFIGDPYPIFTLTRIRIRIFTYFRYDAGWWYRKINVGYTLMYRISEACNATLDYWPQVQHNIS
jgi:hypothetical protein